MRDLPERATGIEPALSAWEADVMPFHYARRRFFSGIGKVKEKATLPNPSQNLQGHIRTPRVTSGRVANHVT